MPPKQLSNAELGHSCERTNLNSTRDRQTAAPRARNSWLAEPALRMGGLDGVHQDGLHSHLAERGGGDEHIIAAGSDHVGQAFGLDLDAAGLSVGPQVELQFGVLNDVLA